MIIFSILLVVILGGALAYRGNNTIDVTYYRPKISDLPKAFDGYKILQISDLHNKLFGREQEKIIKYIIKEKPDIIVVTGDLVDRRRYEDKEHAILFLKKAVNIAPVYYVTGNHEWWSLKYESELRSEIIDTGVKILEGEEVSIKKANHKIYLAGIDDPSKYYQENGRDYESYMGYTMVNDILQNIMSKHVEQDTVVLLSHRPELIDIYAQNNIDLIFSGHAHGGQIRLPFIGGIIAPNQGFFPELTGGMYKIDKSKLIVSRGLGNSLFPFRINNNPEIVVAELKAQ